MAGVRWTGGKEWPAAIVANALIFAVLVFGWWLHSEFPERYNLLVQEDAALEWATTFAFLLAAVGAFVAARRNWSRSRQGLWFLAGVGLFCFLVGMEEISWGQRILGYRPPEYFLANNFQQELNVHNIISTDLRKVGMNAVVLGYGVLLPVLSLLPAIASMLTRVGVVTPPVALAPSFIASFALYSEYPWDHSGEWVEMMVGLAFLFAIVASVRTAFTEGDQAPEVDARRLSALRPAVSILAIAALVGGLGLLGAWFTRTQRASDPALIETAKAEAGALQRDFLDGRATTECNRHKRLYTFLNQYKQFGLLEGQFVALEAQGLPEARARFFLDPWNSPYWLRDRCSKSRGRRLTFVYSFGPNRRRDTSRYEILGDDIGAWIRR